MKRMTGLAAIGRKSMIDSMLDSMVSELWIGFI